MRRSLLGIATLLAACEGSITGPSPIVPIGPPPLPPGAQCNLPEHVGALIDAQCLGCHTRGRPITSFEAQDRATWTEGRWLNAVTRMLNRSMPPQKPLADATLADVQTCLDQNPLQPDGAPPPLCPMPTDPAPSVQLRMSRTGYANALRELFSATASASVSSLLDTLPEPSVRQFSSEQPEISPTEIESYVNIASQLAFFIADDPNELRTLEPCLGTTPIAAACVQTFLRNFGHRVYRRPMGTADLQYLNRAYQLGATTSPQEGVATVLLTALSDWEFIYLVESSGTLKPGATDLYAVTDHELAARLAYALWEGPPDDALLAAADQGFTDAALGAQVDRMLGDPRARAAIGRFYEQWLGTTNLPIVPAYFGATNAVTLRTAIRQELRDFTEHVTLLASGSYADLMSDRTAFISDPDLARIYGVPLPSAGAPAQLPAERGGVLTRAAWLMTPVVKSSNAGHVIKRGVRMAGIVCSTLPPPDPALFPAQDPADPATSPLAPIRARFWEKTSQSQCIACHTRIDAWGGAFGHFGSAGQHIATETVFGTGGAGDVELNIDSVAFPNFDSVRDPAVNGGAELSARLAASTAGPQCFAKQLATNFSGRQFSTSDGCWVERGELALKSGSLKGAIKALVMAPEFRLKKLSP